MTTLRPQLAVHHGAVNVGVVHDGGRALLLDYGGGSVRSTLDALGVRRVERVLFTHHHRDQASGAWRAIENGARIGVPAGEQSWFADVEAYWGDTKRRWHIYDDHPHPLMLAEPLPVHDLVSDGDVVEWGPARLTALATPGHTDGSLSYIVEVDGVRVAFTGDLLFDAGQAWELYSLQKGEGDLTDYHGFLGARGEHRASLERVREAGPDFLVPSHGRVMSEPAEAIDTLLDTYGGVLRPVRGDLDDAPLLPRDVPRVRRPTGSHALNAWCRRTELPAPRRYELNCRVRDGRGTRHGLRRVARDGLA